MKRLLTLYALLVLSSMSMAVAPMVRFSQTFDSVGNDVGVYVLNLTNNVEVVGRMELTNYVYYSQYAMVTSSYKYADGYSLSWFQTSIAGNASVQWRDIPVFLGPGTNVIHIYGTNTANIQCTSTAMIYRSTASMIAPVQGFCTATGSFTDTLWHKVSFGTPTSDNVDTGAEVIVPFVPCEVEVSVNAYATNGYVMVATTTNQIYYGAGITAGGKAQKYVSSLHPSTVTYDRPLTIHRKLMYMFIKGNTGLTYQVRATMSD